MFIFITSSQLTRFNLNFAFQTFSHFWIILLFEAKKNPEFMRPPIKVNPQFYRLDQLQIDPKFIRFGVVGFESDRCLTVRDESQVDPLQFKFYWGNRMEANN